VDEAVHHVRQHLNAALNEPVELAGYSVRLSVSSGAAVFPRDAADTAGLLAAADAAMYRDKGSSPRV
jgi:predicted signal transduction protein with EAL and GGDEF domain